MPPLPCRRPDIPTPRRPKLFGASHSARVTRVIWPTADDSSRSLDPSSVFAEELQRAKLDAMKELAYGASHEINNPLANIALRAQTLLKRETEQDKRDMLAAIYRQAMRAHEMISDLMLFARPPALRREQHALHEVIQRVVEELAADAQANEITIDWRCNTQLTAWIDPMQLAVALRAVVQNSLDALGRSGVISIECCDHVEVATISVRDNGPGIPAEVLPHVFDPFFSGREAGRGLGFGLSKCWRIVTSHGGEMELKNLPAGGVITTLTLPTKPAAQ